MSSGPRVLVLQHEDDAPAGLLEPALRRAGLGVDVLAAHRCRAVPASLDEHVGLVVLGGAMGAEDDGEHGWLAPTRALVAGTVAAGRPFLGICLGHQLATVALGGRVERNPRGPLHALCPFRPTPAGLADPLTSVLEAGASVLHWNNDVATRLPEGAVSLAVAADGSVQAARLGPRAWGVQFHPEVDPGIVARWSTGPDPAADEAALADFRRRRAELQDPWIELLHRFGRLALAG